MKYFNLFRISAKCKIQETENSFWKSKSDASAAACLAVLWA